MIELRPEPRNPADPRAVAVYSERGVQIGYLTAERCGRISSLIRRGVDVRAVFQEATKHGAIIRASFDEDPVLPEVSDKPPKEDLEFWPDPEWPEDFAH